ncbi:SoxR reducing system RseC family protein [Pseudoalteromonas sp. JBTF-M23]|uniref:SoxR reducing system RseC family protein n=1 Tax=Pseudoalteromonas caenipelagi TaxID=2726988 RepID=A0A849V846_9GAMM|nr:SoxR reducing system RseC family protein [Pseudoalteromonas caenipelagi]NOU49729.1 SoxR reducing system RseC family protein [Pseudoalteromonas caenipelagi]
MIEQTLTVVSVSGTTAYLQAQQKPACEGCNGKCGSQIFAKLFGSHKKTLPIKFEKPVQIGQKVKLSLDDSKLVSHSFYVYMLPIFGAFLFAFISVLAFAWSEPKQILSATVGGLLGFLLAKWRVQGLKHEVKVVKIYPISMSVTQIDGD